VTAKSLRVLVVEDRAEDAELAHRELMRGHLPCEIRRVDRADEFRRALTELTPDIVLADYTVPGFGGIPVLAARCRSICCSPTS
jgi:CheY-like chemotaxis protein